MRPVVPKSPKFRVAKRPPFTLEIAAIMPSGADIPRPCRTAVPMIPIDHRGFLGQPEDPISKPTTPIREPLLQTLGTLTGSNFLDAEGDLGDRHSRTRKFSVMADQPCDHGRIGRLLQRLGNDVGIKEDQSSGPA